MNLFGVAFKSKLIYLTVRGNGTRKCLKMNLSLWNADILIDFSVVLNEFCTYKCDGLKENLSKRTVEKFVASKQAKKNEKKNLIWQTVKQLTCFKTCLFKRDIK